MTYTSARLKNFEDVKSSQAGLLHRSKFFFLFPMKAVSFHGVPQYQNCKMAPPGSQLRKIQAMVMQNEEKLCATLSNEQMELFEKCQDIRADMTSLRERESFEDGFCLGVKIMAAVMSTMNTPSVDDQPCCN